MPATLTQFAGGANDFDGTAGSGLFDFAFLNGLARTTGVVIHTLSYVELPAGPTLTTNVQFWAIQPGGSPTDRVPLGDGEAAEGLLDANGVARLKLCGHVLERNPGKLGGPNNGGLFWEVICVTQDKSKAATCTLTYDLCDFNESEDRGSREI